MNDEVFRANETENFEFSDEELTALALAGDPDAPIDESARPWEPSEASWPATLPRWYMPAVALRAGHGTRRQKAVIGVVVALLLMIEVSGLCSAFGQLVVG